MEYYYVSYEVSESYPSYNFIIKAENWAEAKELAEKEIADCYEEEWEDNKDFYMSVTNCDDLINRLKIN